MGRLASERRSSPTSPRANRRQSDTGNGVGCFPFRVAIAAALMNSPAPPRVAFPFSSAFETAKFGEALKPRQSRSAKAMSSGEKGSEENATRDASWRSPMKASAFWPQPPSKIYPTRKPHSRARGSSTRWKLAPAGPPSTSEGQKRPTDPNPGRRGRDTFSTPLPSWRPATSARLP